MRISVIITNCNYADYICEAIESALVQTQTPDEIIVVDDGSTDDSVTRIEAAYSANPTVKLVQKKNGGHIAAFNTGVEQATGDILFFLDADDYYAEEHIEKCVKTFSSHPRTEFLFTAYQYTGDKIGDVFRFNKSGSKGFSPISVYFARYWAGGQTSTLAIRRSLAERIFPYPESWTLYSKGNGEVGLVYGASIFGAQKYYLREASVYYRIHKKNRTSTTIRSNRICYEIQLLTSKVTEHYWKKSGLSKEILTKALSEFKTIEYPSKEELKVYQRLILRSPQPLLKRLEQWFSAWKYFKRSA